MRENIQELICSAKAMVKNAYAPYSHFYVGAALLTDNGKIYTGANIENASYPAGCCAERTAIYYAAAHGMRRMRAIAICGGVNGVITDYCAPCGVCRQVMREFCDSDELLVILAKSEDDYKIFTLAELLPESFGPSSLKNTK